MEARISPFILRLPGALYSRNRRDQKYAACICMKFFTLIDRCLSVAELPENWKTRAGPLNLDYSNPFWGWIRICTIILFAPNENMVYQSI